MKSAATGFVRGSVNSIVSPVSSWEKSSSLRAMASGVNTPAGRVIVAVGGGEEPEVRSLGEPEPLHGLPGVAALLAVVVGHTGASMGSSRTRIVASATSALG